MHIRKEIPQDYPQVYELVKKAFATAVKAAGDEQDYLNELRQKETFIADLSFVAENDSGAIIGQIVLSKMQINNPDGPVTELLLSPVSVDPSYVGNGVGRSLIEHAINAAQKLGYHAVFLSGNPDFYTRVGFSPSYKYDIYHVDDQKKNADWCLVREISDGFLATVTGTIDIV